MSTKERHRKFEEKGWQYVFGLGIAGSRMLEVWAKPNGELIHWAPGDDVDNVEKARKEPDPSEYSVLAGVQLPQGGDGAVKAGEIVRPVLTWDTPLFVGVATTSYQIKCGAVVTQEEVIPWLDQFGTGKLIVAGSGITQKIADYLKKRHERECCDYWFFYATPNGCRSYRNSTFLDGRGESDPRFVLPLQYYKEPRAAVRREAITRAFDVCYERVRRIVRADKHPERMHVIAETPDFVIFGEPGMDDKLEREYGV